MTMLVENSESELVRRSVAGDRDAFGLIVERYQRLICGIAYSATGSLGQSEDLGQEVFVTAWQHLGELREVEKLRGWLCGIARNVVNNHLRSRKTEPQTGSIENAAHLPTAELSPPERAIKREEESVLWSALGGIPQIYREPMVLFYRQGQSVERVAEALELSQDAVKQRLARGRKILHEEMVGMVEETLARSNPGPAFTVGVLTALPGMTMGAKAAALTATAAKGSASAKAAGILGALGAVLSPVLILVGYWVGYKMSADASASPAERNFIKRFYVRLTACIAGFLLAFAALIAFGSALIRISSSLFTAVTLAIGFSYLALIVWMSIWAGRERRKLFTPPAGASQPAAGLVGWEYRSKATLFGWPLVHIRMVRGAQAWRKPVKAWVAVGEAAVGILFAFGGNAVGAIAIGGAAFGLIAFGGCAVGPLSIGGFSLGIWADGGLAMGWQAFAGCAIAWDAAMGGVAVARHAASGYFAAADLSNSQPAYRYMDGSWFFALAYWMSRFSVLMNLIWVAPLLVWQYITRRAAKHAFLPPHSAA